MTYYDTAVYCVGEGWGEPVKVGYSSFITGRISSVATHTWRPVVAHWAWWGGKDHEAALKVAFKSRHIRNEWYWDGDDAIKTMLANLLPSDGIGWPIKMQVQSALRKAKFRREPFPGMRGSFAFSHEKLFPAFNAYWQDQITELAGRAGISLTDDHFAVRDAREIEAALQTVAA